MIVVSPERMKKYDAYAIETWGIPSAVLMENAGRTTYRLMRQAYLRPGMKPAVICGPGNNGGDGFVIARYAAQEGFATTVFLLAEAKSLKGDALINMRLYESMGGRVIAAARDAAPVLAGIKEADLIVDAIFGTGLSKEVGGVASAVIDAINGSGKTVISGRYPVGPRRPAGRPPRTGGPGGPYLYLRTREAGAVAPPRRRIQGQAHGSRYLAAGGGRRGPGP